MFTTTYTTKKSMTDEQTFLSYEEFIRLAPDNVKTLIIDELFTDVTLFTGDNKQIKVRKVIHGPNNQFFEIILLNDKDESYPKARHLKLKKK